MYEENWISGCEGITIRHAGKQYILYSEARYTLSKPDYWYSVTVDADAKEVGTDNYVTIFWNIPTEDLDSWIASDNWNSNIDGVIPIDPPMDWEDLSSDVVDEIIRNQSRERERASGADIFGDSGYSL